MRVRLLSRDFEISDTLKQQLLYGVAVLVSILSVFSIIFMFSYYSEDPAAGAFPSSSPSSAFTQQLQGAQDPRVAGAQTQNQQLQQQPLTDTGPSVPSPKPSPSPTPLPSPSSTPEPTPTPTPSPSPSPTPTPGPDHRPKITNIAESDKTDTSIKLKFSVDKSSDCKTTYWSTPESKKDEESSTKRTTTPEISITSLIKDTEYTYTITCKEIEHESSTTTSEYKFKTNPST